MFFARLFYFFEKGPNFVLGDQALKGLKSVFLLHLIILGINGGLKKGVKARQGLKKMLFDKKGKTS